MGVPCDSPKHFLCKIKKCMMTFCQSNTDTEELDVKRIIV